MSHSLHTGPEGTLWFDGCLECEARSNNLPEALGELDARSFMAAWDVMVAEKWGVGRGIGRPLSLCDHKLVNTLYALAVPLERVTGLGAPMLALMMHDYTGVPTT